MPTVASGAAANHAVGIGLASITLTMEDVGVTHVCGNLPTEARNRLSNACTVGRIGFGAIGDVALLDVFGSSADLAGRILEQSLAPRGVHHSKEVARLLIVVVVDAMVPVGGRAVDS